MSCSSHHGRGSPAANYASMLERHIIGLAMQEAEDEKLRRHYDFSTPETTQATLQPLRDLVEQTLGWMREAIAAGMSVASGEMSGIGYRSCR
jgi:hypothetical protein